MFYTFTIGYSLKLDDKNFDNLVTVYPNPSHGKFTVQMQGFNGDVALELTNVVGQSLWRSAMKCMGSMVKQEFEPQLPPGVYLLRMSSGNTQSVKKLVIQ